jgi:hypothetical protein
MERHRHGSGGEEGNARGVRAVRLRECLNAVRGDEEEEEERWRVLSDRHSLFAATIISEDGHFQAHSSQ